MKLGAYVRAIKGRGMTTSWTDWVHLCKWTMAVQS